MISALQSTSTTTTSSRTPPPSPADPLELRRVEQTRLRVRMFVGQHVDDVKKRVTALVGAVRSDAWGEPDLSSNAAAASARAVATLYDPVAEDAGNAFPTTQNEDDDLQGPAMDQVLARTGLWAAMSRHQAQVVAFREMLTRWDCDGLDHRGRPRLRFRPVTPDLVEAVASVRDPMRPVVIRELVLRRDPKTGEEVWTREVWSVEDPDVPFHTIVDPSGRDCSEQYGLPDGGLRGEAYPCRRLTDGRALLPYVVHHAEVTGALFDPFRQIEVWDGTLTACCLWTLLGHLGRNAAHGQRYMGNAQIDGASMLGDANRSREAVVADASVVLSLRPIIDDQPMVIGQWEPTADVETFLQMCLGYERRIHSAAGLDPADAARVSGDPRSGYALEISDESKVKSALRNAPVMGLGDAQTCELVAVLYNRALGFQVFNEDGWTVEHAPIRALRLRAKAARAGAITETARAA